MLAGLFETSGVGAFEHDINLIQIARRSRSAFRSRNISAAPIRHRQKSCARLALHV
jgi:hypothetical protein